MSYLKILLKNAVLDADLSQIKNLVAQDTSNELGEYSKIINKNLKTILTQAISLNSSDTFHDALRVSRKKLIKLAYYPSLVEQAVEKQALTLMDSWLTYDPELYDKIIEKKSFFVSCVKANNYEYFKKILNRTQTQLTEHEYYLEAFSHGQKATLSGVIDDILKEKPNALNYAVETSFFAELSLSQKPHCAQKFKEYVQTVKDDLFYANKSNKDMIDNIISSKNIDNLNVVLSAVPLYRHWLKKRVEFGFYKDSNDIIERALFLCEKLDLDDQIKPLPQNIKNVHKI